MPKIKEFLPLKVKAKIKISCESIRRFKWARSKINLHVRVDWERVVSEA